MKKLAFLTAMMIEFFSVSQLSAQTKIAFISVDEVVQLMPEYKRAMADLAQFDSSLQNNYALTIQELNRLDSTIKSGTHEWSPAVKDGQKDKMKKLLVELQGFEEGYQQQMKAKREALLTPIAQKANLLISEVAKSNGFNYVFRKEALLVFPETDDLLPLVKRKL